MMAARDPNNTLCRNPKRNTPHKKDYSTHRHPIGKRFHQTSSGNAVVFTGLEMINESPTQFSQMVISRNTRRPRDAMTATVLTINLHNFHSRTYKKMGNSLPTYILS